jgi:hypothetical protein
MRTTSSVDGRQTGRIGATIVAVRFYSPPLLDVVS